MKFDMLDDDFLPLDGYAPTMLSNSRSGNMRKLPKKDQSLKNSSSNNNIVTNASKPTVTKKPNLHDEFDDLLEQMLDKQEKKQIKKPTQFAASSKNFQKPDLNKDMKFSAESFFTEKDKFAALALEQKTLTKPPLIKNNFNATKQTFSLNDDIISEDDYGKKETKVTFAEEPVPLRKRQSFALAKQQPLKIVDDQIQINVTSSSRMKPPIGRNRASVTNVNINNLSLELEPSKPEPRLSIFEKQTKVEPKGLSIFDKPKEEPVKFDNLKLEQQKSVNFSINNTSANMVKEQIIVKQTNTAEQKAEVERIRAEHKRELDNTKQIYERQIKFISESLEKQLKEQKQSKEKMMKEFKELIQKEKHNYEKHLKEEIERVKDMNKWEKQKMDIIYNTQITSLKTIVEHSKGSINHSHNTEYEKRRLQDLEAKLKAQLQGLQSERKRFIKQEEQLEQRQAAFKKFKLAEEQKLREQYNKLSEKELKGNKKVSEAMKQLMEQKEQLAMEMATIEMDLNRKKQQLAYGYSNLELQKQAFQRNKLDMEKMNNKMYNDYKAKMQEAEELKKNALRLQNDLVNKLRIVEMRAKQVTQQGFKTAELSHTKENNWTRSHKVEEQRSYQLDETDRFKKVEEYVKNQSVKQRQMVSSKSSKFNLQDFMVNVDKSSKNRQNYNSKQKLYVRNIE